MRVCALLWPLTYHSIITQPVRLSTKTPHTPPHRESTHKKMTAPTITNATNNGNPIVKTDQPNSINRNSNRVPPKARTVGGATSSSFTVTVTMPQHRMRVNQSFTFAGATPTGYNGTWTVLAVVDADTFTYTSGTSGMANATGTLTVTNVDVWDSKQSPANMPLVSINGAPHEPEDLAAMLGKL